MLLQLGLVFLPSAAPAAPAAQAKHQQRLDLTVELSGKKTPTVTVTAAAARPLPDAVLKVALWQDRQRITVAETALGTLAGRAARDIELTSLPAGTSGVVAEVTSNGKSLGSKFLALSWHRGKLISAGSFAQLKDIALQADRSEGHLSDKDFAQQKAKLHQVDSQAGTLSAMALAAGTVTVSGRTTYRAYNNAVFPNRAVQVELVNATDFVVATTATDASGNFSITADVEAGSYRVRILSVNPYGVIGTRNSAGHHVGYSVPIDLAPGTTRTGITVDFGHANEAGRAFALLDAHYSIGQFYMSIRKSGWPASINVEYPNGEDGSYRSPLTNTIHISGGETMCGTTWCREDAFDWDVLAHEVGHHVAAGAGLSDSDGGAHEICTNAWDSTGSKSDGVTLAWSEGWATFFGEVALASVAIPSGMPLVEYGVYKDLRGPPHNTGGDLVFGLEGQDTCVTSGEDSELAVQRALWDMWADGGTDEGLTWTFTDMLNRLESAGAVTFSEAVAALSANRNTSELQSLRLILQMHGIVPKLTEPVSGVFSPNPVTFKWSPGGSSTHPNNQFGLKITNKATGAAIVDKTFSPITTGPSYTPTASEWQLISAAGDIDVEIIGTQNTHAPVTGYSGPKETRYIGYLPSAPRIMVVGDSISQGHEGDYTWRYRLKQHLNAKNVSTNFVGPYVGTQRLSVTTPPTAFTDGKYGPTGTLSFDSGHFAKWGWQAAQARYAIQSAVAADTPDYLLVELGFNDLGWSVSDPDGTLASITELVANARAAKPDIRILIANVVHRSPLVGVGWLDGAITSYNNKLAAAIPGMRTAKSPVHLVDLSADYNYTTDTYDGLHPNFTGEHKIARAFANVLASKFFMGAAFGNIPTAPAPFRPAAPTTLDAMAVPAGIHITWQHSFGATGYWLYSRNVTLGESFQRSAMPIGADSWLASWVFNGHIYEYYVVPMKGDTPGGTSPSDSVQASPQTSGGGQNIVVMPGSGYVDVSWDAPVDQYSSTVHSYKVHYFDQTVVGAFVQTFTTTNRSMRLNGLTNGHLYTIAVSSVNAAGEGWPAGGPNVIPGYGRPAAPTLQSTRMTSSTDARLTWTASTGAAGYYVLNRNWSQGGPFTRYPDMKSGTSADIGWLFPADQQDFCMIAANGSLQSASSNCLHTTQDAPTLTGARLLTESSVRLTWTASPGAGGYRVYKRDAMKGTPFTVHIINTPNTTLDLTGLGLAEHYEWYVVALSWTEATQSVGSNKKFATTNG